MHLERLDWLACPDCGLPLRPQKAPEGPELVEGALEDDAGHVWPVIRGIPRLTPPCDSVESFGFEWTRFDLPYSQEKWDRIVGQVVGREPSWFRDKRVVDAGCGAGFHSRWLAERGAERVLALDLSQAVERARESTRGLPVDVVQGDLAAPPVRKGSADFVLCVGVIQHTRDPETVLLRLLDLLKPGGELGVSFYTRREGFSPFLFLRNPLRRVLRKLPNLALYRLTWLMSQLGRVPGLGWLLHRTVLVGDPDDRRWLTTWLCTYDWYGSHAHQRLWRPSELREMFERLGLAEHVTDVGYRGLPGCYRIRRPKS